MWFGFDTNLFWLGAILGTNYTTNAWFTGMQDADTGITTTNWFTNVVADLIYETNVNYDYGNLILRRPAQPQTPLLQLDGIGNGNLSLLGNLHAGGDIAADGHFLGSGAGLTNIPGTVFGGKFIFDPSENDGSGVFTHTVTNSQFTPNSIVVATGSFDSSSGAAPWIPAGSITNGRASFSSFIAIDIPSGASNVIYWHSFNP